MRLFNSGLTKFTPNGLVLEIAAGLTPAKCTHISTDTDIERVKENKEKGIISFYADGTSLLFKNNSFDYVLCMHLAEHLEHTDITKLLSELYRVAPRGYIEVPAIYWELLHNCDKKMYPLEKDPFHHKQYCFYNNNTLHFIRKLDDNVFSREHKILREIFRNITEKKWVSKYRDILYIGIEWDRKKPINIKTYNSLDEVPENIFKEIIDKLLNYKPTPVNREWMNNANKKQNINITNKFINKLLK